MKKIRLGIYIEDSEYGDRLTCYFMNHYKDQLEIHMYTMKEQLEHLEGEIDIMLSSELDQWNNKYIPLIQIVEETPIESEEGIYFVEKYQEVNRIVEEILKHVGGEVRDLTSEGSLIGQTRLISVYSLADNQYQMPFAMTLSSILSENEKVLLMDFQENSGLSRMLEQSVEHNLDELLVMAESGRYSTNRINSCIGRKHKLDYVYPIENTECLCEINTVICNNLLQMLGKEMHYDCIVLNMGTRFKGFFDILDRCSDIYLVQKKGGISQWREYEFTEELIERGLSNVVERIIRTALRMRPDRIIVGECRGAEALDMLQAMNTGHDGSLSTGHANSPHDIISRIETMVLQGQDFPLNAIRQQIASGIDIIVQLGRLRDKSRRVLEISEVDGFMDGEIVLHTLYRFEETAVLDSGRIQGFLKKAGTLCHTDKLMAAGLSV